MNAQAVHAGALGPPGVYLFDTMPQRLPAATPPHGVPLFVGFAALRDAIRRSPGDVVEFDRWERFEAALQPGHRDGILAHAVKGFFVNGGLHCSVLALPTSERERDALSAPFAAAGPLEDVSGIDLVCVPDAAGLSASDSAHVYGAILAHCRALGNRFAIIDTPRHADGDILPALKASTEQLRIEELETEVRRIFEFIAMLQAPWPEALFGACYTPWLQVESGLRDSKLVPPCGHVAGLYARTDARVGVHKAPANDTLEGVLALARDLDPHRHEMLNAHNVNCIVEAPGRGIRVQGARTFSTREHWQYVPLARVFIALTAWLQTGLDDLVFESHTPMLWEQVRRRISAYCLALMRAGTLAGADPASAFFVKCDAETNPPDSRALGRLQADIGLAPVTPAEFVVVRVTQDAGGVAVSRP